MVAAHSFRQDSGIAQGYADIAHLLADADLAPLRKRSDYADLL
jgi:hypothetical protein